MVPALTHIGRHTDLYIHIFGEGLDSKGLTRRKITGKILAIHLIDVGKEGHVAEQDRRFHDLVEADLRFAENGFQVMHHLVSLVNDIGSFQLSRRRVDRDLSGDEEEIAGLHGLAIRPNRGGGIRGIKDLLFHGIKLHQNIQYTTIHPLTTTFAQNRKSDK